MRVIRLVACLVAFTFVLVAAPQISVARTSMKTTSSHHVQARRKRHKRAKRHKRKRAKSKSGMEF